MPERILFVVNKTKGTFSPSETFLKAHMKGMKCQVITLLGLPGRRVIGGNLQSEYLQSQHIFFKLLRWVERKIRRISVTEQDNIKIIRLIRQERIDLVFAEYGTTGVSIMEACDHVAVPLVVHFHGWDAYTKYNLSTYGQDYKRMFSIAASIIAVSQHMKEQLLQLGADESKIFVNPCGADLPEKHRARPATAPPKFVMIGRLTKKKAPLLSIEAFAAVLDHVPDASLEIIGDGPLREECHSLVKKLNIENSVILRGSQPHHEVIKLLEKARCFIQHSVTADDGDREGTPVSVLEAMGMGLPVVSTFHGGICDVIKDGDTGSLVEEHDIVGMTREMLIYAKNPSVAEKIGNKARQAVMENWTNEKSMRKLWSIIEASFTN